MVLALQNGLGEDKENKGLGVSEAASVMSQDAEGTQVKLMGTISFDADYVPGEAPSPRITSQVGRWLVCGQGETAWCNSGLRALSMLFGAAACGATRRCCA